MEQKKSPKKILIAVLIAAVVAFLGFIFVVGVIRYFAPGPMPEGYTREHHEYGDILEYAKAIDPDATVSEDYVDLEYNEESKQTNCLFSQPSFFAINTCCIN